MPDNQSNTAMLEAPTAVVAVTPAATPLATPPVAPVAVASPDLLSMTTPPVVVAKVEVPSADAAKVGAPEKYEFKSPEGQSFDADVIASYSEVARELNLSQESAQKLLDHVAPKMHERQLAQIESVKQGWRDASTSDKEFGGEKLGENLTTAKKSLDKYGSPEFKNLLESTGLGNHPEFIRYCYRVSLGMVEDKYVGRSGGVGDASGQQLDVASQAAKVFYANNK